MAQPLIIDGNWFNHATSKAVSAQLTVPHLDSPVAELRLEDRKSVAVEIVSISDRLGAVDRQLTLSNKSTFVTGDNDAVDQINGLRRGFFSRVSSIEAFHPRLLVLFAMVVAVFYGLYAYGLPAAARVAAWATPAGVVKIMDDSTLSTLNRFFLSDSKIAKERQKVFQDAFADMVKASEYEADFQLLIRDGGNIGPNALALPAGTVVVTDQLINLASDEEIIAVLGHEISHVTEDHSLQQIYRALGFAGMVAVVAGDLGAVAEEVLTGGGIMVAMSASREMELDADEKAISLLEKTGHDPEKLIIMLDKLYEAVCRGNVKSCEESGWFSSHPGGAERREALREAIEAQ